MLRAHKRKGDARLARRRERERRNDRANERIMTRWMKTGRGRRRKHWRRVACAVRAGVGDVYKNVLQHVAGYKYVESLSKDGNAEIKIIRIYNDNVARQYKYHDFIISSFHILSQEEPI